MQGSQKTWIIHVRKSFWLSLTALTIYQVRTTGGIFASCHTRHRHRVACSITLIICGNILAMMIIIEQNTYFYVSKSFEIRISVFIHPLGFCGNARHCWWLKMLVKANVAHTRLMGSWCPIMGNSPFTHFMLFFFCSSSVHGTQCNFRGRKWFPQ